MSNLPKTVCIESPFRNPLPEVPLIGEIYRDYLHECLRDSLSRGEAPFAGHAYLPDVLDDDDEEERRRGIDCHSAWLLRADDVVIYVDFGVSDGMSEAMTLRPYKTRALPAWDDVGGYVRGFILSWKHGQRGSIPQDSEFNRGLSDGATRNPTAFRP